MGNYKNYLNESVLETVVAHVFMKISKKIKANHPFPFSMFCGHMIQHDLSSGSGTGCLKLMTSLGDIIYDFKYK